MAITIEDPEVEALARRLAAERGVGVEQAVAEALRSYAAGATNGGRPAGRRVPTSAGLDPDEPEEVAERMRRVTEYLEETRAAFAALPVLDPRPGDEMLYDEFGLPK